MLHGQFGEIRITRLTPESSIEWRGELASSSVELEPGAFGTDTREVLGVVTNRYTVIQNKGAFAFLANLLGSLAFETAGSRHGGKRVFVTCRLAGIDHVEVGGDQVDPYVNFFNRHDGAGAVQLETNTEPVASAEPSASAPSSTPTPSPRAARGRHRSRAPRAPPARVSN